MFTQLTLLAKTAAAPAQDAGIAGTVKDIATNFKILPELFIPQVISFLLVAILLKKFAFGPVQAMLEQRKQRIADGEAKLKQIEKQLAESAKHTEEVIAKANADAKRMIDEAKASASSLTEQKAQEAIATAQNIIAKAEAAAQAERARIEADLKSHFGRLVAATAQQATGGKLTADQQRAINEESLARVQA
jgi:F-type H+-transporting ATPase subunit b